jgi:outer membrane murein-binding lipoprotein Lpp
MTDLVKIALISAAGGALPSVLGFINNLRIKEGFRSVHSKMDQTSSEVKDLTSQVNGKMNRLLAVTGDAREAIGNLAGHAQEKADADYKAECLNYLPRGDEQTGSEAAAALPPAKPAPTDAANPKKKKP